MVFANKRAVITGAASGIGRALAVELARRGAKVLLSDLSAELLEEATAAIGGTAISQVCDVSDHAQVEALAAAARARMGGCNLVFANAGVIASGKLVKSAPVEVDWIFGVNIRGAWSTAAVFTPLLHEQPEGGHFVFTGSEHSLGLQHAGVAAYTASKHAVLGLAEVLRAEAPDNVKVSILCPGLVDTALGSGPRPAPIGEAPRQTEGSKQIQTLGMSAEEVARRTLDGVAAGHFYIVTHPHAIRAAERRFVEIEQAFAAQAPWFQGAEKWEMGALLARIAAERKAQRPSPLAHPSGGTGPI